jgi:cytidine deaminase
MTKAPLSEEEETGLVAAARAARDNAKAPYSGFKVGSALLAEDGTVFGGCNVESASYGLTMCGERTAVFKAVSEGRRSFRAVVVFTGAKELTFPCGGCRQVLWDQCGDIQLIVANTEGEIERTTLSAIFPRPFAFEESE